MGMDKIAAVVVTYNRKNELMKNLSAQLKQTLLPDKIFIIDNCSTDGTYEMLQNEGFLQNGIVEFYGLTYNTGGAGGFSRGVESAYEQGFDWIVMMDDDGRPYDADCFNNLFNYIADKGLTADDKVFLNALVMCNDHELSFGGDLNQLKNSNSINDGCDKSFVNPFNGTVISRGLVKAIGIPNAEFFIRADEMDYYRRAQNANAVIGTVMSARYYHPARQNRIIKKLFGREIDATMMEPWKEYYWLRNTVYSVLNTTQDKKKAKKIARHVYWSRIYCALTVKCKKCEMIRLLKKAYKDGKTGRLGKTVFPKNK